MTAQEHSAVLSQRLKTARDAGVSHLVVYPRDAIAASEDVGDVADAAIVSISGRTIQESWREIGHADALEGLVAVVAHDMAYSSRLMEDVVARDIVTGFMSLFQPDSVYLTNGGLLAAAARDVTDLTASWMPTTDATFDTGVVAIDETHVGVLWIVDDD